MRTAEQSSEAFIVTYKNYTGTFLKRNHTAHSPLMTGTFTLSIGGVSIDPFSNNGRIPYNVSDNDLKT